MAAVLAWGLKIIGGGLVLFGLCGLVVTALVLATDRK